MACEEDLLLDLAAFSALLPARAPSSLSLDAASSTDSEKTIKKRKAASGVGKGGGKRKQKAASGYESDGQAASKPLFAPLAPGPVRYSQALDWA